MPRGICHCWIPSRMACLGCSRDSTRSSPGPVCFRAWERRELVGMMCLSCQAIVALSICEMTSGGVRVARGGLVVMPGRLNLRSALLLLKDARISCYRLFPHLLSERSCVDGMKLQNSTSFCRCLPAVLQYNKGMDGGVDACGDPAEKRNTKKRSSNVSFFRARNGETRGTRPVKTIHEYYELLARLPAAPASLGVNMFNGWTALERLYEARSTTVQYTSSASKLQTDGQRPLVILVVTNAQTPTNLSETL
ncbi:hypothetical protein J3F84DRAFT_125052 [Trichoderma pleuroticola]